MPAAGSLSSLNHAAAKILDGCGELLSRGVFRGDNDAGVHGNREDDVSFTPLPADDHRPIGKEYFIEPTLTAHDNPGRI
jgi:hypothetical protein